MIFEKKKHDFRIFLDMDGTIADFDTAFRNIAGATPLKYRDLFLQQKELANVDKDLAEKMFVTSFWMLIGMNGKFWQQIPPMKDFKKLWKNVKKYNPIILTAIPEFGNYKREAITGKREWINKHMSNNVRMITIDLNSLQPQIMDKTPYCSGKRDILIDDNERNIHEWIKSGGKAIHFTDASNTIKQLKGIIKEINNG